MNDVIEIDGFYPDAMSVREFALSLPFAKSPQTNYPGERTGHLQEVAPEIFAFFEQWFLGQFGHLNPGGEWTFNTQFQRIAAYRNPAMNEGWVHADVGQLIGGVIYLNPTPDPGAGTSLCRPKGTPSNPNRHLNFRNDFYGGRNGVTEAEYLRARDIHNSKWEVERSFENSFNKLIAYPATAPHKQNGFGWGDESRLTQVFFAKIKG